MSLLDNCEHLIDACATLLDQLLNIDGDLRVISTSREALGVSGEKVFSLHPLSVPAAEKDRQAVASTDAVKLFVDRAQLAQSGFYITDQNALDIAEICRRLDGIPLAIELAAARVRVLSVSQIRQKLDDRFRLLTIEGRTALPRHQAMQAAIGWSYEQLSPDEQRLLRLISVFAGGCTLELVALCCERTCYLPLDDFQILDLLTRLIDKSLVITTSDQLGQRRYTMLETVRAFAYERLVEAQEADLFANNTYKCSLTGQSARMRNESVESRNGSPPSNLRSTIFARLSNSLGTMTRRNILTWSARSHGFGNYTRICAKDAST